MSGWGVEIPEAGPLSLDEDMGWYSSPPVAAGALRGAVGRVIVTEDLFVAGDEHPVRDAVAAFLAADDRALHEAGPHVYAYYLDTVREAQEQGWALPLPDIPADGSVWDHVSFGTEFHVDRPLDGDGPVYVSVECECAWEPEHGLQLVFRDGRTITKVGPFDGHLTNGSALDREESDTSVYVSSFEP